MKAIVYTKYGSPDNLSLVEMETPTPKDNEVLIRTKAVSINSWDWDLVRGTPFYVRLAGGGLRKPMKKIIGCDVAGEVELVGKKVKHIKPGDEVFGDLSQSGWGGFAEFVCAKENALTLKPSSMSFEEAAAIPQAGVMALQGIRDYGKVQSGQRIAINGAGGGVGTFAIQMAKMLGAEVTAVDLPNKFEMMKSLGADDVVDYTQEDFTQGKRKYDMILDVVGHHSLYDYKRILTSKGVYSMVGGPASLIFQSLILGPIYSKRDGKKLGILAHDPNKNIESIIEFYEHGKVKPIIDRLFPLSETPEAFKYFGTGQVKGKLVITC